MTHENSSEIFTVRIPRSLRARLEEMASREGRPVANLIRKCIEDHLANGHMKLVVVVEAPDWADAVSGHGQNYRIGKFANALRIIAENLQSASGTGGVETSFDHGEVRGRYNLLTAGVKPLGAA